MYKDITEVFCFIDDFAKIYEQEQKKKLLPSNKQRCREGTMGLGGDHSKNLGSDGNCFKSARADRV